MELSDGGRLAEGRQSHASRRSEICAKRVGRVPSVVDEDDGAVAHAASQVRLTVSSTGLIVREDNKAKKQLDKFPIKKIQFELVRTHASLAARLGPQ